MSGQFQGVPGPSQDDFNNLSDQIGKYAYANYISNINDAKISGIYLPSTSDVNSPYSYCLVQTIANENGTYIVQVGYNLNSPYQTTKRVSTNGGSSWSAWNSLDDQIVPQTISGVSYVPTISNGIVSAKRIGETAYIGGFAVFSSQVSSGSKILSGLPYSLMEQNRFPVVVNDTIVGVFYQIKGDMYYSGQSASSLGFAFSYVIND